MEEHQEQSDVRVHIIDYEDVPSHQFPFFVSYRMFFDEQIKCYGMPVSDSIFDTVFWSGRFCEAWSFEFHRVPRMDVKMHHCHNSRAGDSNIRTALIDRFGPPGTKKAPGLTYGLKKDLWAAFALAVYWVDTQGKKIT